MRNKSDQQALEVYAVAGTHTAVLCFDFKNKPQGLVGFAIERKNLSNGTRIWLMGQKCFESIIPDPVKGQQYPTHLHPVQSFLWKDFTLAPNESYRFKITPVFGKPDQLQYGNPTEIDIKTEKEWDGKQGVYFNRGVSGSQSFSTQFPNKKVSDMDPATRERALEWLSRGLAEGLKTYINSAKKNEFLYGSFYEFHEAKTLGLLREARDRGVKISLILDGKQYGDKNKESVEENGIADLVKTWRTNAKIPHNKFLVHCDAQGKPLKVWTGSTNISEKGIFGQCNTGHAVQNKDVAAKYLRYWKALEPDPERSDLKKAVMELQADLSVKQLPKNISVFFSPRSSEMMLDVYAQLVAEATEMVCGIFPFNVNERFQRAFNLEKSFPRYIIVDKKNNAFQANDRDLDIAVGAYIKESRLDQWVQETSAGKLFYGGTDFVHNKILLIDPLGKTPIIVAGSANFSPASTDENDENMLVLKGIRYKREADIYFTEFIRLFDHFNFREWLNTGPADFKPFLEEGPAPNGRSWVDKHFDNPEFLSVKRKMLFKNMVI